MADPIIDQESQPKKPSVITGTSVQPEEVSMDTSGPSSVEGADQQSSDPVSSMIIDTDTVWDRNESADLGLSLDSLYECTSHNCNVLHACAGSDGVEVEDDKSGFVGYVGEWDHVH